MTNQANLSNPHRSVALDREQHGCVDDKVCREYPSKAFSSHPLVRDMSGSAMIECALLMVVFVPVFVGVSMIGKLIDLRQTTEQAGRYGATRRSVKFACNFFADKFRKMKEIFRMTGLINEGRPPACFQSLL